MSEHFSHIAVYEDTVRLIRLEKRLPALFMESLDNHYDSGMLASGSRGNHLWAVPILEKYKGGNYDTENPDEVRMKIAGALGWLTHRGADLVVKPVLRTFAHDKNEDLNEQECSAYFDADVFRRVYASGEKSTLSPFEVITPSTFTLGHTNSPMAGLLDTVRAEDLFTWLFLNGFTSLNRFFHSDSDCSTRIELLASCFQEFTEDFGMYALGFRDTQSEKHKKYLIDTNHYAPSDPVIALVRRETKGGKISPEEIALALDPQTNTCIYARCLLLSLKFVNAAADYFEGKLSKEELLQITGI